MGGGARRSEVLIADSLAPIADGRFPIVATRERACRYCTYFAPEGRPKSTDSSRRGIRTGFPPRRTLPLPSV
jgi:hypothetical protein